MAAARRNKRGKPKPEHGRLKRAAIQRAEKRAKRRGQD